MGARGRDAGRARAGHASLKSIDNYASYDCRGRNRVVGAKLSEHGKANALDIRSLKLANGTMVELTDPRVPKDFRQTLRARTCARFMTVLGPGSDGYHENRVHVISQRAATATACASGTCVSRARKAQSATPACRCQTSRPK